MALWSLSLNARRQRVNAEKFYIQSVVVPGSSDFEDLAVVFSAYILCENKTHVYLSDKVWSNKFNRD